MPNSKKAKEQRRNALAKARAKNSKNQSFSSHNVALHGSQLEISANSESDATPEDLSQRDYESDATPEDLSQHDVSDANLSDLTSDSLSSTEFSAPADRLLIIPLSFILNLLQRSI